ncbi:uncharacterized protein FIBRA_05750 [Fibroporia radiculosa]|uniref:ACB domain-containing protein n=1 Tax=Fibroporia radiculosa TaxID=599839 RepID=J4HY20_9APHY|nr:uncharacterized protein FIBRA_05750 [Fibroporia radiculosa]CCM03612.1 predicted protein [Fibroporia radiculosa]
MPVSEAKFNKAVEIVQGLPKNGPIQPSQDDQLYFYKHYKQATVGNVNTTRPGMLDFGVMGHYPGPSPGDAWKSVEGLSKEEAQAKYVEKLLEVLNAVGDEEAKKHIAAIEATE